MACHGTCQQVLDFPLQNGIGLDANGVVITFFLQQTVQCRIGKGRITAKEFGDAQVAIPLDHRKQGTPPELCTVVIAAPQHGPFQVAELIEQE